MTDKLLSYNAPCAAVLWDSQVRGSPRTWRALELLAKTLGIQLQPLEVRSVGDFDKAFADAAQGRAEALFIFSSPLINRNRRQLAALAAKSRLPSISQWSRFPDAGGLMSYGADRAELFRRAAAYVDKILQGRKPGDLPIEQPKKFKLVINMKTAKALG